MADDFGTLPNGEAVKSVKISAGDLSATFLTYGAILQDLRLRGHPLSLVLGFDDLAPYLDKANYFGALVGRCANRIRDGHFLLGGTEFSLDRNENGKHCLHGGTVGINSMIWRIMNVEECSVVFELTVPDGLMGFPGNLTITAGFAIKAPGCLDMQIKAKTDKPTICNIAHHSYFVLDRDPVISNYLLKVGADHYTPVNEEKIATGQTEKVAATRMDFTRFQPIQNAFPIDHNFCLSSKRTSLRKAAMVQSPKSGISLDCWTTEPGLQVYDGNHLNGSVASHNGRQIVPNSGVALEPQIWPDAIHHPNFPGVTLAPDETYFQHSQFRFSLK